MYGLVGSGHIYKYTGGRGGRIRLGQHGMHTVAILAQVCVRAAFLFRLSALAPTTPCSVRFLMLLCVAVWACGTLVVAASIASSTGPTSARHGTVLQAVLSNDEEECARAVLESLGIAVGSGTHVCDFVTCSGSNVVKMDVSQRDLKGTLRPAIGRLVRMSKVDVSGN